MTPHRTRTTVGLIAALLWSGDPASAQGWEIGAKAGVSHGALSAGQEFVWNATTPTMSLFMRRPLTSRLSIAPEISLLRRAGVSTQPGSTLTLTADFLELPLMLQLYPLGRAATVQPYLSAGPSVAVRLRCTLDFQGGGLVTSNPCDASPGWRMNRVDLELGGGAGIDWRIGPTTLGIEARATTGLRTNVLPIDAAARSYGWVVSAGVSTFLHWTRAATARPARPPRSSVRAGSMRDENIAAMILAFASTDVSYDQLVPRRSSNAALREFAQRSLAEHLRIKQSVYALLLQLDIGAEDNGTSTGMRDESTLQRNPMYFIEGAAFDSSYVEGELRVQREFLTSIDDVMLPRARSLEMRAFLTQLRPTVAAHLASAERLRSAARPLLP